jgi:hypothetical protein
MILKSSGVERAPKPQILRISKMKHGKSQRLSYDSAMKPCDGKGTIVVRVRESRIHGEGYQAGRKKNKSTMKLKLSEI